MLILDKLGWPIEKIKGRPVVNFFRMLLHGRKIWGSINDWNTVREYKRILKLNDDIGAYKKRKLNLNE